LASIVVAILLVKGGVPEIVVASTGGGQVVTAFLAGVMFASLFTVSIAIAILAQLALTMPPLAVALVAATGALFADVLMFLFARRHAADEVSHLISTRLLCKLVHIHYRPFMQWLAPAVGAIFIATPLPDEVGLTLMGVSKTHLSFVVPFSYTMHFFGILSMVALSGLF